MEEGKNCYDTALSLVLYNTVVLLQKSKCTNVPTNCHVYSTLTFATRNAIARSNPFLFATPVAPSSSSDPSPKTMSRMLRRLCTTPFKPRLEPTPALPELPDRAHAKSLIREANHTLRALLKPHDTPVILRGPKGVGKSTLLAHAVQAARASNQIVLYIPDARVWTHGRAFFAAAAVDGLQPHLDGLKAVRFYDRPAQTADLFHSVLEAHGEYLKSVPSRVDLRSEITKDCDTLHDLLVLGDRLLADVDSNWRLHPEYAGSVLAQFIEELLVAECPAAIVVDNYTALAGLTCMRDEQKRCLHANGIRVVAEHLGRDAVEKTAERLNGPFVIAAETKPTFEEWRASRVCGVVDYPIDDVIRADPSGRIWWHGLVNRVSDNGLVLDVPPLEVNEQRALCATFPEGRNRANDRLVALAGGRADVMRRIYATR